MLGVPDTCLPLLVCVPTCISHLLQTLNVTATLCLCDCPGLVLPQYAQSKAEMVAAGAPATATSLSAGGPAAGGRMQPVPGCPAASYSVMQQTRVCRS